MSLAGACHCGRVRILVPRPPEYLNDCNCTLCVTRGGLWGYFRPDEVRINGDTTAYRRRDLAETALALHFCGKCGSPTHWVALPEYVARHGGGDRMGVNMKLFARDALSGIECRFPDGLNWDETSECGVVRPPEIMS